MKKFAFARMYMFPFEKIPRGTKIIIWGKGILGTQFYREVKLIDYFNDVKWVDTDSIEDEQQFIKDNKESVFVIGIFSARTREDIVKKLLYYGVEPQKIITENPRCAIYPSTWCIFNGKKDLSIYNEVIKTEISRYFDLIKLKSVAGYEYVRVGAENDGGYVMLDDLPGGISYSFGISDDVSWDDNMASYGYEVYMYDHTIAALPHINKAFHFFREGVADYEESEQLKKLETFINRNNHTKERDMILKIDVEGAEWGVFENIPDVILKQFSQIVVEFHGLCNLGKLSRYNGILEKINRTHQPVHYHINNYDDVYWFDDKPYGNAIEMTFANRQKYKFVDEEINLPRMQDAPNCMDVPEIIIGKSS